MYADASGPALLRPLGGDPAAGRRTRRRSTSSRPGPLDALPGPARLLERHHRAHRGRGDLERHHRVQGAAQPQRRHHAPLDVGDPRHALPRHHLPRRADRRACRRSTRRSSRSSRAPSSAAAASLYLATIGATTLILVMAANTAYAGLPAARGAAGGRRLPAAPAHLPRQPARLLARHRRCCACRRLAPDRRLRRERHRPHPALRDRRLPLLHPVAGRAWRAAGGSRAGSPPARRRARAGSVAPPRPALAPQDGGERRSAPCCTAVVTVVFAVTKFRDGAWVVAHRDPDAGRRLLRHPPPLPRARAPALAGGLRRRRRASTATA